MLTPDFEKLITDLAQQVQKRKIRCLERFVESAAPSDMVEAQRGLGAERALEELRRRLHSLDPNTPPWVREWMDSQEPDFQRTSASGTLSPHETLRPRRGKRSPQ